MKRIIISFILLILVLTGCVSQNQTSINNSTQDNRIIATSLATAQILDALNLDLVGVASTSGDLPERYQDVTSVGTAMNPDLEIIKSLNPTDVIGPSTLESSLKQSYEQIGVNSTFIDLKNLYNMHEDITQLGEKYDRQSEAQALVENFNNFLLEIEELKSQNSQPKVLVLMGLPGSYVVATENSYIGHLVSLAGGINPFTSDTEDFLNISPEAMLEEQPDIILRASHALPEQVLEMFAEEFETNPIWQYFDAVKNGKVYDLDYSLFGMSANLDYPEALEVLKNIFYNDLD